MEIIKFIEASFRNFLSYGNNWQTIKFEPGIFLVQGYDEDTQKSNGSGKSSLMEVVSFALFGQLIKSVKKDDIVNWINKKNCEVILKFSKGEDVYEFHRSIKPNKFKVLKNGDRFERIADLKIFQSEIEQDIIGMDFRTFKNLVYFSPNHQKSIIDGKKDDKRKFLESLFDLSVYSRMLENTNSKLKNLNSSCLVIDNDISHSNDKIESLKSDIDNIVIPDTMEYKQKINYLLIKLDALKEQDINFDKDEYDRINNELKIILDTRKKINNDIQNNEISLSEVNAKMSSIDIEDIKHKTEQIDKLILEYNKEIDSIEIDNIEILSANINDLNNKISELKGKERDCIFAIKSLKDKIRELQKKQTKLSNESIKADNLIDCPTCKQKVDHNHINDWITREKKRLNDKIENFEIDCEKERNDVSIIKIEIEKYSNELDKEKSKKENAIKKYDEHKSIKNKIEVLQGKKDVIPDIEKIKKDYSELKNEQTKIQNNIDDLKNKLHLSDIDIESCEKRLNNAEEKREVYIKNKRETEQTEIDIIENEKILDKFEKISKDQSRNKKEKNDKIIELEKNIDELSSKSKQQRILIDHLEYLKYCLQDKNVRQYAISTFLPFINEKANSYLLKSGFNYSVIVDGWLDVQIKGFGTGDINYNSLSGGERRAVDFAIQLACNDLSSKQAKTRLSICICDEILDSSLDSRSVEELMNIISVRQKETNDSVFIITHREELKDMNNIFDGIVKINKENGFSHIE